MYPKRGVAVRHEVVVGHHQRGVPQVLDHGHREAGVLTGEDFHHGAHQHSGTGSGPVQQQNRALRAGTSHHRDMREPDRAIGNRLDIDQYRGRNGLAGTE